MLPTYLPKFQTQTDIKVKYIAYQPIAKTEQA